MGAVVIDIRDEKRNYCFAAFDIGTTTLAGYLLDAKDGRVSAVESRMNPQIQYGADVIMRSDYALAYGTKVLSECIQRELNDMVGCLVKQADKERTDILQVCVVGNTCMHHLFLGISPAWQPAGCWAVRFRTFGSDGSAAAAGPDG
ncbi:MAG: ATP-binding protein [Lachnospiraceae bacterium]|uniref:hypothetical protein n=1 Tax=Candidatus Merdisoma sp. JLR.KK006 TaxID=3112626 RepID=UPI002FF0FE37|nr:ATP-binding protein [Lachnospiraceae bacterium]